MPRITIIDTDLGIDEAVAVLLALGSPEFDVVGVSAPSQAMSASRP